MKTKTKYKPYGKVKSRKYNFKLVVICFLASIMTLGIIYADNWLQETGNDIHWTPVSIGFSARLAKQAEAKNTDIIQEVQSLLDDNKIPSKEQLKELVAVIAKDRDFKEVDRLFCLIKHESGWNSEAVNLNLRKNGSISGDYGVLQFNTQTSPIKITRYCSFNPICSTNQVINYLQDNPDGWYRWFGWKANCQ